MTESLITVKQLPEIEENLKAFKSVISEQVNEALQMVVTEDTLQAVKNKRAELNKQFKALEEQRKKIKKQILAPIEAFEQVYYECVSKAFTDGDNTLKMRIDEVENGLKNEKYERINAYYDEYCEAVGIDFVPFEKVIPSVTRSTSDKQYKERCKAFIDKVIEDLSVVASQPYPEEVIYEYKASLNLSQAIHIVNDRHNALQREREKVEKEQVAAEARQQAIEKVEEILSTEDDPFTPPVEEDRETVYNVPFTVTGTKDMIILIKKILTLGGYLNGEFNSTEAQIFRSNLTARLSEINQ